MKPVAEMSDLEKAQTLAWVENWKTLGPILEDLKRGSLKRVNTADAIEAFDLAYKSARSHLPCRKTSGLIEQQYWFKRGHR